MLQGIVRESIGKRAAKDLRRDGYLIANIYGKGFENINAAFKKNEFIKAVKNKSELAFEIKLDDQVIPVVIQEYQKDPVTSDIKHVDLKVAQEGIVGKYMIPVKTVGVAKGLKDKGVLVFSKKRIKVKCDPANLPASFTLDVSDLGVGDNLLIRDIVAPEGVTIMEEDRIAVVGIIKAK